jgi:hypothetical protein
MACVLDLVTLVGASPTAVLSALSTRLATAWPATASLARSRDDPAVRTALGTSPTAPLTPRPPPPVAVLGQGCRIPDRVVHAEPDKPPEQQVEVDPFDQLALRTDRVERLPQQCSQQPLRRDQIPPHRRIQRIGLDRHLHEGLIDDGADRPRRIVKSDPLFQVDVAERRSLTSPLPGVRAPPSDPDSKSHRNTVAG